MSAWIRAWRSHDDAWWRSASLRDRIVLGLPVAVLPAVLLFAAFCLGWWLLR